MSFRYQSLDDAKSRVLHDFYAVWYIKKDLGSTDTTIPFQSILCMMQNRNFYAFFTTIGRTRKRPLYGYNRAFPIDSVHDAKSKFLRLFY